MSYYSDFKYGQRNKWFERLYYDRWFKDNKGPILDAGCAAGDFIAINPDIIEGFDIDEENLQKARAKNFKVRNIDINKGGMSLLENNRYQGILARHIIEHLDNPLDFLKEIRRILKPKGKAIILTPNCPYALNRSFWNDYTHKRPFTRETLAMIAYDAGFRHIKIYEDFRCLPGLGFLMRTFHLSPELVSGVERLFFIRGLSLILEAEKD